VKPLNVAFRGVSGWVTGSLLPAFRDAAHKVIPALKDAFHSVAQSVKDNHGLFQALGGALKLVGKFITGVVIPALALFYSKYLPLLGKGIAATITAVRLFGVAWTEVLLIIVSALKLLVTVVLTAFSGILHAADAAFGWIPGIGDKIHGARVAFDKFKDGSISALDKTAGAIKGLQDTLNNLAPVKKITIKMRIALDSSNKTALALLNLGGRDNKLDAMVQGRATGGPVVAGQPYVVGEHRPELFVPNTSGRIIPEVPGGGSRGPQFNVEKVVAQDVNDFLRQMQTRSRHSATDGIRR
jgi:hypothetical protein